MSAPTRPTQPVQSKGNENSSRTPNRESRALKGDKIDQKLIRYKLISAIVLAFIAISLLTSFVFDQEIGSIERKFSANEEVIGPITIEKKSAVYEVIVQDPMGKTFGRKIQVDLLGEDKKRKFNFMGDDEHILMLAKQNDSKTDKNLVKFSLKMTLVSGSYFFRFTQTHLPNNNDILPYQVSVSQKRGSSLPHFLSAILFSGFLFIYQIVMGLIWTTKFRSNI